jgi:hypothetical protein
MNSLSQHFSPKPDVNLYHYTGFSSVLGMSKSKAIWATSIHYLNDAMELLTACEAIDWLLAPTKSFARDGDYLAFVQQFSEWIDSTRTDTDQHLFIFSLSEADSQLSQWRSYTPHGKGVCLGFSPEQVAQLVQGPHAKLGKCIYEQQDQLKLLELLIATLWADFESASATYKAAEPSRYAYWPFFNAYALQIYQVLALIKHNSFSEEREWRIISGLYDSLGQCGIREGKSMFTPYIELHFPEDGPWFNSVLLGPSPHRELSLISLRAFMQNNNLCDNVDACEIPYREW